MKKSPKVDILGKKFTDFLEEQGYEVVDVTTNPAMPVIKKTNSDTGGTK